VFIYTLTPFNIGSPDRPEINADAETIVGVENSGAVNLIFILQFSHCQTFAHVHFTRGFDERLCNETMWLLNDICDTAKEGNKFVCTAIFSGVDDDSSKYNMTSIKSKITEIVNNSIELPHLIMNEKGLTENNVASLLCNGWLKNSGCDEVDRYIDILYSNDIVVSNSHDILDFILAINPLHKPLLLIPSQILESFYMNGPDIAVSKKKYCLTRLMQHRIGMLII
jgi:hypothetical protein